MTLAATHALAPSFQHTTAAPDVTFTFASGVTSVPVTLPTAVYRMWLAPSASCYLRALAAVCDSTLDTDRSAAYTVVASLSAAGIFSLRIISAAGLPTVVTFAATVWKRLGMSSATPTLSVQSGYVDVVGTFPVWHLALITSAVGAWFQPHQPGGSERTNSGVVYTLASPAAGGTSWSRDLKVSFQPTTPTYRATLSTEASALYPDEAYMGALGTLAGRESSVLDVLAGARNALCGWTQTWQTARLSTAEAIWRAYVAPASLLSTPTTLLQSAWMAYCEWELGLVAPSSTPTETRA